ncbi:MAG: hypothetical protein QXU40_00940 [Candidatus Pacearchaeota archaeon]
MIEQEFSKTIKKTFLLILFFLSPLFLYIKDVNAAGIISPERDIIIFKPGLELNYTFYARSNTDRKMNHSISVEGGFSDYIYLKNSTLELEPGEAKPFIINIKLPERFEPGFHITSVCVAEDETRGGGGGPGVGIGVRVIACSEIKMLVLYPEPNLDFDLLVENVMRGENISFILDVRSLTTQDMIVKGNVEVSPKIFSERGNKVASINLDPALLEGGSRKQIKAFLNTSDFEAGEYIARATLFFVDNKTTKEKSFRIGEVFIEIISFNEEVVGRGIVPVNIEVESKWNNVINNVYADVEIRDNNGQLISKFSSSPVSIGAWEIKNITAYWDISNINAGEYRAQVRLNYENKISVKEGIIRVKKHFEVPLSITTVLIMLVAVLSISVIILLIKLSRKQKDKRK